MRSLQRCFLPAVVFITGASVLIVEVLAVRVLSPYYGNTIYTVSSVISVILLALSVGYYFGGILADRRPSLAWFFGIIMASGLALLSLHVLGTRVLPALGESLSLESGPLVSSAFLFLLPALLLGTISPYAVTLQQREHPAHGVGTVAGTIFFWSTLGSIVGSLLAGFVLIPAFGIDTILTATSLVLMAVGAIPLLTLGRDRRRAVPAVAAAVALAAVLQSLAATASGEGVVYAADGVYQKITIYEGAFYGRPARFLLLDRSESGAMFLDSEDPTDLVYDYTKYYGLYRVFTPEVRRALVLGGGAYSIPKALLRELPDAEVDVAEIEPSFFELAKRYFSVQESPRLHNHVEDGRRFLQDTPSRYDLIFGDVYYSYFSVPPHFTTREFFELAKARLTPDGVFIANMIGDLSRRQPSLVLAEIKTFREVFPNSYFYAVESPEQTKLVQNITLVGLNGDRRVDVTQPPVTTHPDPLIRFLRNRVVDVGGRYELSPYPVLTDAFSPVEYLTAQVLRRSLGQTFDMDGDEMAALADQQRRYGARHLGGAGRERTQELLRAELGGLAQEFIPQSFTGEASDEPAELTNFIGRLYASEPRRVVLAAPNAAASATAVLLELTRTLLNTPTPPKVGIDIVTFDGSLPQGRSLGAAHFAARIPDLYGDMPPIAVVVLDGVCDPDFRAADHVADLAAGVRTSRADALDEQCSGDTLAGVAGSLLAYVNGWGGS
jgi:spermidine synthase